MLLAHKVELRPTSSQFDYLQKCFGHRRHCFNQLLDYFRQPENKWSKAAAYRYYIDVLRLKFPWYSEVSSRVTRNAIDDLDSAFKHFFRRVKNKQTPGFPKFKKKGMNDSFALREAEKFSIDGRKLRIEGLKTRIKMRQKLRFSGILKAVTISQKAGKVYASVLVETQDYPKFNQPRVSVGVDFGIKEAAVCSDAKVFKNLRSLQNSMRKLLYAQRNLASKQRGSNRRAKAKLRVAKLHCRISRQRQAIAHAISHYLTANYQIITLEDLNVAGMLKNHSLARAIADVGFSTIRRFTEYKAVLRDCCVVVADRFFPSSKTCPRCGCLRDMPLSARNYICECGYAGDRDLTAAYNLNNYGRLEYGLPRIAY